MALSWALTLNGFASWDGLGKEISTADDGSAVGRKDVEE